MRIFRSIAAVAVLAAAMMFGTSVESWAAGAAGGVVTASSSAIPDPDMFEDDEEDMEPGMLGQPGGEVGTAPGSGTDAVVPPPAESGAISPGSGGDAGQEMEEEDTPKKRRLKHYFVLKGGLHVPSNTFDLDTLNPNISNGKAHFKTETSVAGELALGHYLLPVLAVELGAGYFQRNSAATMVRVVPIMVSAKLCLPLGPFEPYGMGGIGAFIADQDIKNAPGGTSDTTYGFQLGTGFNVRMHRSAFLGLEGKYLWAEPTFRGQNFRLNGFITTINLGFRF